MLGLVALTTVASLGIVHHTSADICTFSASAFNLVLLCLVVLGPRGTYEPLTTIAAAVNLTLSLSVVDSFASTPLPFSPSPVASGTLNVSQGQLIASSLGNDHFANSGPRTHLG